MNEYTTYSDLLTLANQKREALGLLPYANNRSLSFYLIKYNIPFKKKNYRCKLYHVETFFNVMMPLWQAMAKTTVAENEADYMPLSELFSHVQRLRENLKLPQLKRALSMCCTLQRKKVKFIRHGRNKLYHVEEALRALSALEHPSDDNPINRVGTKAEIESGEYAPISECMKMFRCSRSRLTAATNRLAIKAWRHPHTNRVWCNIKQAMEYAFYRSYFVLRKYLGAKKADHLKATRPKKLIITEMGATMFYFCPEYSHLGTENTGVNE